MSYFFVSVNQSPVPSIFFFKSFRARTSIANTCLCVTFVFELNVLNTISVRFLLIFLISFFAFFIFQAQRNTFHSWVLLFLISCTVMWFQIKHIIVRSGTNYWYGLLCSLFIQLAILGQNSAKRRNSTKKSRKKNLKSKIKLDFKNFKGV